jgi:parvulin-like peptidyl-prolyl isomerase
LDTATKEKGGRMDSPVSQDGPIPGMGNVPDLQKAIFAASSPVLLESVYQTNRGWEIVKLLSIRAQRQKGFDEVRQEVMMSITREKQQEVQQDLIQQMQDKYDVIVHTSAFGKTDQETPPSNTP